MRTRSHPSKRELRAQAIARQAAFALEERRVATQRKLFEHLETCPAKDRLLKMMEERVIWLLDHCRTEEADAILEFMPEDAAGALLDEFFEMDAPTASSLPAE